MSSFKGVLPKSQGIKCYRAPEGEPEACPTTGGIVDKASLGCKIE